MTKTETIMSAMKAALASAGLNVLDPLAPDPEPTDGQVHDDIESPYTFGDMPCIVLDCGNEYPDPVVGVGWVYWNLSVLIQIADMGPMPKMAPEPTRARVHAALYADRTLGDTVVDLSVGPISRNIDEENPACGITQVTYNLKYRVMEGTA